jgi:hypothetical protein
MRVGAEVAALNAREGHVDLFAIDAQGVVRSSWWEADPNWQPWFSLP